MTVTAEMSTMSFIGGASKMSQDGLVVRQVRRDEVTPEMVSRWRDLISRSCHSNVFLSPDFLVPAWEHLDPSGGSFLLTVEELESRKMLALGCFEQQSASTKFPLRHMVAAKTIHTYRTGLLLDDAQSESALDAWLSYIQRRSPWSGVVFPNLRLDSILAQRLQSSVSRLKLKWHTLHQAISPAFFPPVATRETVHEYLSSERRKSMRRNQRRLEEFGPVTLRVIDDPHELSAAVETFLDLEHMGWKGEEGTSLRSNQQEAEFLRRMSEGFFSSGKLVLTQLMVGDRVAATAVNLLGGTTLFAFKIGWDPQFAKGSPGSIHELMLLPLVLERFEEVTCVDSCSLPDSYLTELWPHEVPVGEVAIPTSTFAEGMFQGLVQVRRLREQFKDWRQQTTAD